MKIAILARLGPAAGALESALSALGPFDRLVSVGGTLSGARGLELDARASRLAALGASVLRGEGDPDFPNLYHPGRLLVLGGEREASFFHANPLHPDDGHAIRGLQDAAFYFPATPGWVGCFGAAGPSAWVLEPGGEVRPLGAQGGIRLDPRSRYLLGVGPWGLLDLSGGCYTGGRRSDP